MANLLGAFFLSPVALLPGWLSINIISAILGVLLLLIFKYTSNQSAIARIRDDIKANFLAIKLYRESSFVALRSQIKIFVSSFKLLFHSIVPMLFMILPVSLIIVQMGMWFQARPFRIDDDPVIIKMKLNRAIQNRQSNIRLEPQRGVFKTIGRPVRVFSKKEIYWKIAPEKTGYHSLVFQVNNHKYEKLLAVGDGFMRLSSRKPSQDLADVFLFPLEKPFPSDSIVRFIDIDYPERVSKMYGTDWWIVYFFISSMVFAFIFKPFMKVRI